MEIFCVVIGAVRGHSTYDFVLAKIARANLLVARVGQFRSTHWSALTVEQFGPGALESLFEINVVLFSRHHAYRRDVFEAVSHADTAVRICHMHLHLFKFIDLTLSVCLCVH